MKNEKDCKIVQDLLPNYIENLTNETTNQYINDHINECKNCKNVFENMKKEFELKSENSYNHETNCLRKFSRRHKILKSIILIIVILIVVIIARKLIVIYSLANKAEKYDLEMENRYEKVVTYSDNTSSTLEIYHKDENILARKEYYNFGEKKVNTAIVYKSEEEAFILIDDSNGKRIKYDNIEDVNFPYDSVVYFSKDEIPFLLFSSFQKINLGEKKCYMVRYKNTEQFIDVETGLLIKYINNNNNETTDYYYEFGNVEDSDIVKPDISEYTM